MHKLFFTLLFLVPISVVMAKNPAANIAKLVSDANKGFKSEDSKMKMILINGESKIEREMTSKTLEVSNSETRTLMEFLVPRDIRGTKLLTWVFESKDDSQWIFFPKMKKKKRITSSGKTSSFMGSEFSFEDLRDQNFSKFEYSSLQEKKLNGVMNWIYSRKAKGKSAYSKQVLYVDKAKKSLLKVEYFDRSGELLKVANFKGLKSSKVGERVFWRPSEIEMKNVQTNRKSILIWTTRNLGAKLKKSVFSTGALK